MHFTLLLWVNDPFWLLTLSLEDADLVKICWNKALNAKMVNGLALSCLVKKRFSFSKIDTGLTSLKNKHKDAADAMKERIDFKPTDGCSTKSISMLITSVLIVLCNDCIN